VTPFFFQYIAVAAGLACTVHAKVIAIPGVSRYSRVGTVTVGGPVTAIERYIDNYTHTAIYWKKNGVTILAGSKYSGFTLINPPLTILSANES
jgi:hypothetical protein